MITITETLYKKMPDDIKACFSQLPNPSSEEVRECFPETVKSVSSKRGADRNGDVYGTYNLCDTVRGHDDNGGNASRFFKSIIYTAKASKSERNEGCEGLEEKELENHSATFNVRMENGVATNKRTDTKRANNHPTVKPIALMEYLIKMVTPKGGIVLEPFAGSGSTLVAAEQLGFKWIGIELNPKYIEIAQARISAGQLPLFPKE